MTTNPFDTSQDPIRQRVMVGLNKISLALKTCAWQNAGQQGLTPTQGQILTLLRSTSNLGMRLSEVADGLAVTPATASDAVTALVEKNLVQKSRAPDDARAIAITLTERGVREADSVASWPDSLLSVMDELSVLEQEVFLRCLIKMVRSLQERGQIPVAHMCVTCHFFRPNVYSDCDRPHHCALVNAPFGDRHLRLECPEHITAEPQVAERAWQIFLSQTRN
ncbi:MarR family winged helix-turn-helix transcriptional regulator [Nostoc sp. C057]|uniref:MarR family winged helix-turn-helix transcriptional regulator n=1 Tax=Nostoc sp. C057 TaxID=2576903 RepID=UPI0021185080|nr:MarR family winged helix-turn-helix transcriptional regulator [Nostoc sp. C057]